jgi:DNA polymerase III delta subunit
MLQRQLGVVAAKFTEQYGIEAITQLDASEIEAQNLLAEIVNINLFAPRRLIIVKNASDNKTAWEVLGENLNRVPDETNLIIVATKPDKRTRTYKELLKSTETREFPILQGSPLQRWLIDEALTMRIKIDAEAVDELLTITSGDSDPQARIAAELAKFQVLGRSVTVDLVRQVVEPNLSTNAFEILNLAATGRCREVAIELKNLRESGEDANKFFGLLASQVFALTAAVFAGSEPAMAGKLKIHPFQLSQMSKLARELGDLATQKRWVKKTVKVLAETDVKMKSTSVDSWILAETALAKITS